MIQDDSLSRWVLLEFTSNFQYEIFNIYLFFHLILSRKFNQILVTYNEVTISVKITSNDCGTESHLIQKRPYEENNIQKNVHKGASKYLHFE